MLVLPIHVTSYPVTQIPPYHYHTAIPSATLPTWIAVKGTPNIAREAYTLGICRISCHFGLRKVQVVNISCVLCVSTQTVAHHALPRPGFTVGPVTSEFLERVRAELN